MRRIILLALLCAAPLAAQGTISSLQCLKRDRAVMMRWIVTPALSNDAVRCAYDYDTVSLDRRTRQMSAFSANSGRRSCVMYDLTPDDDVYLGPQVSDSSKTLWSPFPICSGACTNCDSSDDLFFLFGGSGCDCGGVGEYPKVHTDAEDSDPTPDPPTTNAAVIPPVVTGQTFTVASDCSDFEDRKNDAEADAASAPNRVSELLVPPQGPNGDVECALNKATTFQLEPIANNGKVYMHANVDPKLVPPPGAQIDKTYLPFLAAFTWTAGGLQDADGYSPFFEAQANARGYYIRHIEVRPPKWQTHTPIVLTVTGVNQSTDVITASATIPSTISNGMTVISDLGSTGIRGGQGIFNICAISGATFKLSVGMSTTTNSSSCGTVADLVGTYGSGGTVQRVVALPITGHGESGGFHTVTVTGHKLPTYLSMAITAGSGTTITVSGTPGEYQIGNSAFVTRNARAVIVEGTGVGSCNGLWQATVSGSVITLTRTGSTANCNTVSSGTVRGIRAISIFKTNSDTIGDHEPQSHNYAALDANTLQLLEVPAQPGVTGGYLFWDLEMSGRLINANAAPDSAPLRDVTFDQIVVNWCMPYRSSIYSIFNSVDVAIVNSHQDICSYIRENPVSASSDGIQEKVWPGDGGWYIDPRDTDGLVIKNNYLSDTFLFNDDSTGGNRTQVEDFTFSQNAIWKQDWKIKSTALFRRHFFRQGFFVEQKSAGPRMLMRGNYFKGWLSDFQQTAAAVALSANGSQSAVPNGAAHWNIEYNVFDRGGTLFAFTQANDGTYGAQKLFNIHEKFRIAHNLGVRIDVPKYKSGQAGASTGGFLIASHGYRDFVVERDTWIPERVNQGNVFAFGTHRNSGLRVLNNILGFTEGWFNTFIGIDAGVPITGGLPVMSENSGYAALQAFHIRGTSTDPLTDVSGNIGIPMLKTSSSGTFAVKAASPNIADAHCVDSVSSLAKVLNIPMTWVGDPNPCPSSLVETVADRLNSVFEPGTWMPKPAYSGKGADIQGIADAMGQPGPVTVTADNDEFTLSFHAPSTTGCYGQRAVFDTDWATTWSEANLANMSNWIQDASASQTQSINLPGLAAGTRYLWRLYCSKGAIGDMTTEGTP